ncbi:MAG: hypothetical protein KC561_11050 [Myxococcales bacterium]|nr:hypothetical protein [Myxococcales bacterium]
MRKVIVISCLVTLCAGLSLLGCSDDEPAPNDAGDATDSTQSQDNSQSTDVQPDIDCSTAGCAAIPLCSVGCTAVCGCCSCSDGESTDEFGTPHVCVGGCWAPSSDAGEQGDMAMESDVTSSDAESDFTMSEDSSSDDAVAGDALADAFIQSCDEISATDCFSNYDCDAEEVCNNQGSEVFPVACCVPGTRGDGEAGDNCQVENDCETAVCIEGVCSDTCESVENCPENMPTCAPIAFSGSDDDWCFPEAE